MKLSLRAGEKIYMNGAVFSVDRRVSLQLLNNATFLLETHVMQEAEATTPFRQIYFAIQLMLMDPNTKTTIQTSVCRMLDGLRKTEGRLQTRDVLERVEGLLQAGRTFEALREVRFLYRLDEADWNAGRNENKESATLCRSTL